MIFVVLSTLKKRPTGRSNDYHNVKAMSVSDVLRYLFQLKCGVKISVISVDDSHGLC